MPQTRPVSIASRLTAGCVTLIVLVALVAAGFGWWWKFRATARERAQRVPEAAGPGVSGPVIPDGKVPATPPAD